MIFLAFSRIIAYNHIVVIPLITSLISNPNTPFNKRDLLVSFVMSSMMSHGVLCRLALWYTFLMEHIERKEELKLYQSSALDHYFGGRSVCVLDIETTGLSAEKSRFILGGLYDPAKGILHQIFAEKPGEEAEALAEFLSLLRKFDVAVTYNGRHFDVPFLEERFRRNGGAVPQGAPEWTGGAWNGYDLDLYQVVSGHSPLRRLLPSLSQKTVENYMGLWSDRADEISGAESVDLYYQFVTTGDQSAKERILLHNSDDVLQLSRLMKVLEKCDLHRAMYRMGFPAGKPCRRWQVRRIRTHRDLLIAEGVQAGERIDYRGFSMGDYPMQTRFDRHAGTFRMEIPILRQSGIAAADIRAAGLPEKEFEKYPGFGSGFLVVEEQNGVKYREVNHLVKGLVDRFEQMNMEIDEWN